MKYSLHKFKSINQATLEKLELIGVVDTDQLLSLASNSYERSLLAKKIGVDEITLEEITGMADLVRVNGIGPRTAETLVCSSYVHNVQELILLDENFEENYKKLKFYFENFDRNDSRIMGRSELKEIISEAKELIPRMSIESFLADKEYKKQILADAVSLHNIRKSVANRFLVYMFCAAIVALIWSYISDRSIYNNTQYAANDLGQLFKEAVVLVFYTSYLNLVIIIFLLLIYLVLIIFIISKISWFQSSSGVNWVFNNHYNRHYYRLLKNSKTLDLGVYRIFETLKYVIPIIVLIGGIVFFYDKIIMMFDNKSFSLSSKELSSIVITSAVTGASVTSIHSMTIMISAFRKNNPDRRVLQRLYVRDLIVNIFSFVLILTAILGVVRYLIPLQEGVSSRFVVPYYADKVIEKRLEIENLNFSDSVNKKKQEDIIKFIDASITTQG